MRKRILLLMCLLSSAAFSRAEESVPANSLPAGAICLATMKTDVTNWEAEEVKVPQQEVKISETRLLGHGAGTFLMSFFVDSPRTADNTHWEVVGEFNLQGGTGTCKSVYRRRFEAP
jgi:hypothetical protein